MSTSSSSESNEWDQHLERMFIEWLIELGNIERAHLIHGRKMNNKFLYFKIPSIVIGVLISMSSMIEYELGNNVDMSSYKPLFSFTNVALGSSIALITSLNSLFKYDVLGDRHKQYAKRIGLFRGEIETELYKKRHMRCHASEFVDTSMEKRSLLYQSEPNGVINVGGYDKQIVELKRLLQIRDTSNSPTNTHTELT